MIITGILQITLTGRRSKLFAVLQYKASVGCFTKLAKCILCFNYSDSQSELSLHGCRLKAPIRGM